MVTINQWLKTQDWKSHKVVLFHGDVDSMGGNKNFMFIRDGILNRSFAAKGVLVIDKTYRVPFDATELNAYLENCEQLADTLRCTIVLLCNTTGVSTPPTGNMAYRGRGASGWKARVGMEFKVQKYGCDETVITCLKADGSETPDNFTFINDTQEN